MGNGRSARFIAVYAAAVLLTDGTPAVAAPCLEDAFGGPANCAANDVAVSSISVDVVLDDGCNSSGDTIKFDGSVLLQSIAISRYDIGLYIGEDGDQALTGSCQVSVIPPATSDLDGDACGDTDGVDVDLSITNTVVRCADNDVDGFLDIAVCTSWKSIASADCSGPPDAVPSSSGRCDCKLIPTNYVLNFTESCGDGVLQGGEACDDGNNDPGDCCSPSCQFETSSTVCRPAAGVCDQAESCTGTSSSCPDDSFWPAGTECVTDFNACTIDGCSGTGDVCEHVLLETCLDGDGCCPSGCGAEVDSDCPSCLDPTVTLFDCDLLVKRPSTPTRDRARATCTLDACSAPAAYSPSTDGVRFALSDTAGVCFADALSSAECVQKGANFRCKPADPADTGLRLVKLKALSSCSYAMKLKLVRSDLDCLEAAQSPWVPAVSSGDSCAHVGCPATATEQPTCPGTCGNDVLDSGEQCDGPDDSACAGACDATCTCR